MNSKNIKIKDMIIGGSISILTFPLPRIEKINELNNYLFIIGFFAMAIASLIPRELPIRMNRKIAGVNFLLFKLGFSLVGLSLIAVALGIADDMKFLIIFSALTILLASMIFERQESSILSESDKELHVSRLKVLATLISITILLSISHWITGLKLILVVTYTSCHYSGGWKLWLSMPCEQRT